MHLRMDLLSTRCRCSFKMELIFVNRSIYLTFDGSQQIACWKCPWEEQFQLFTSASLKCRALFWNTQLNVCVQRIQIHNFVIMAIYGSWCANDRFYFVETWWKVQRTSLLNTSCDGLFNVVGHLLEIWGRKFYTRVLKFKIARSFSSWQDREQLSRDLFTSEVEWTVKRVSNWNR